MDLVRKSLVISTWGNVSGYDEESGLVTIKASGVPYDEMGERHMVVLDLAGKVVEGDFAPSTDTPTHLALYRAFKDKGVRGIVHTHSQFATTWAQAGRSIPCLGTTHVDYFYGSIPVTRPMTPAEIADDYELNTGRVIIETMDGRDCRRMSAVLVRSHGPFAWGASPEDAVLHAQVLEYLAKMAFCQSVLCAGVVSEIPKELADKHYDRKFGPGAYYGQGAR